MVWDLRFHSMIKVKNWRRAKDFLIAQAKTAMRLEKIEFWRFFIPWQKQYKRYVHRFRLKDLEKLARENGFTLEESGISKSGRREANLYIVAQKCKKIISPNPLYIFCFSLLFFRFSLFTIYPRP